MDPEQQAAAAMEAQAQAQAQPQAQQQAPNPLEQMQHMLLQQQRVIEELQHEVAVQQNAHGGTSVKLHIQSPDFFKGKTKENINRWLFQVEQYFNAADEHRDRKRVAVTAALLRDGAEAWWQGICKRTPAEAANYTWVDFKELLTKKFKDPNKELKARKRWTDLRQTGSMAEYKRIFEEIAMDIDKLQEHDKVVKFFDGLKPGTQRDIAKGNKGDPYALGLEEMMELAGALDNTDFIYSGRQMQAGRGRGPAPPPAASAGGPTPMEVGALEKIPKLTDEERARCNREGLCRACRGPGHIAAHCPKFPPRKKLDFDLPNGNRQ